MIGKEMKTKEKRMVIYHCITAYQFCELVIHRKIYNDNCYAILLVQEVMADKVPQLKQFIESGFFDKVLWHNPFFGYADSAEQSEANILQYFNEILGKENIRLEEAEDIIVAAAYRNFGTYVALKDVEFSIFEDASGTLAKCDQENHDQVHHSILSVVTAKHGLYYGTNPNIKKIYCDVKMQGEIDKRIKSKIQDFTIEKMFKKLERKTQEEIKDIYGVVNVPQNAVVVFTQWFMRDGKMLTDNRVVMHYQYLCDLFVPDENIVIKPHPADPLAFAYDEYFSDCQIIRNKFPSELLKCGSNQISKVISLNSTANHAFDVPEIVNIKVEVDVLQPLDIYNKLVVTAKLLLLFPEYKLGCYGMNEKFVGHFLSCFHADQREVAWYMPCNLPLNTILIIDYLHWGKGTKVSDIPNILSNADYNAVYIFINREDKMSWWSIKLNYLSDYFVPIAIEKHDTKKEKGLYKDFNREYIWIFSKNPDIRQKVREQECFISLPRVGISVEKSRLDVSEEYRIIANIKMDTLTRTVEGLAL